MRIVYGRAIKWIVVFGALFALRLQAGVFQEGWTQPPDLVLRPDSPIVILAGSGNQEHRFEISSQQLKDRWIRAIEFQPGDSRVVRSAFFTIEKTGQWLGAWSPGERMIAFPETVAASLPEGSKVTIDIYYQSAAEDVEDRSALALYFTEKKPLRPLTGMGVETPVQLPAGDGEVRVRRQFTVIADSYALAVRPEMASAGRSVEITTLDPSGASQVLLSLAEFKKDSQNPYIFEQPVFLAKGTKIVATATYRNQSAQSEGDLFKLSLSMYPSAEYRPVLVPPLTATPIKKAAAKKKSTKKAAKKKP